MTLHATRRRHWLAAGTAVAAAALAPALRAQDEPAMSRIRARGVLTVALYNELPPFHQGGQGIDVGLARLLAEGLGLPLRLMPFDAGESMGDDLRNLVWKGHYLGFGPADVLLHVPVDKPLIEAEPRVLIFGPYYRETLMLARRLEVLPELDSLAALKGQRVAVAGQSLAGWLMLGADGGAYREQLVTRLAEGCEAARLLQTGEVAAAAGTASELYSVLGGDERFRIEPLPLPRAPRQGWAVGMAVKKEAPDLAQALQATLNQRQADGRLAQLFAAARVPWRAP